MPATMRKVTFSCEPVFVNIYEDEENSSELRCGTWRIDAVRFQQRIKDTERLLAPILSESHRCKVFSRICALTCTCATET